MENDNILLQLINKSDLSNQIKMNKIIQVLQKHMDIINAKKLTDQILKGSLENIEDKIMIELVEVFSQRTAKEIILNSSSSEHKEYNDLRYELNLEKDRRIKVENELKEKEKQLKEKDEKIKKYIQLAKGLTLTKSKELITVSDDDINELYISYLTDKQTEKGEAFMINGIIPKTYYRI